MRRVDYQNELSGEVDYSSLVGAKVKVCSVMMSNRKVWDTSRVGDTYTVGQVLFRIDTTGKTFTIVKLSELPDRTFSLKDLTFVV